MILFYVQSALHRCGHCCVVGAVILNDTFDQPGRLLLYSRNWLVALTRCFRQGCTDFVVILFAINKNKLILRDTIRSFLGNCD